MRRLSFSFVIIFVLLPSGVGVLADDSNVEWGDLKGRFVLEGDVPATKTITFIKDAEELGGEVPDESLVVNSKNKGIANIAIYLRLKKGPQPHKEHPTYAASSDIELDLVFEKGQVKPHLLLVRTSQSMVYQSKDEGVGHSPHFFPVKNVAY